MKIKRVFPEDKELKNEGRQESERKNGMLSSGHQGRVEETKNRL